MPEPGMAGWFLLALTAAVMFAAANVLSALLRPPAESSLAMGCGVLLGASAVLLVICAGTGQVYWFPDFPSQGDLAILLAITVNAAFAVLFLEIIRLAGPVFFAQFNYLAVLAGIAWGWLVFQESLNALVWIAFVLMAAGVVLTSLKPRTGTT
jgi:drug/metabolite transporter (DMT)-like permease